MAYLVLTIIIIVLFVFVIPTLYIRKYLDYKKIYNKFNKLIDKFNVNFNIEMLYEFMVNKLIKWAFIEGISTIDVSLNIDRQNKLLK